MAITPEIIDYLQTHNDLVISEAKDIISTITNKEVIIEPQEIKEFVLEDLTAVYPEPVVEVSIQVGGEPEGLVLVFIDKPTAARVGSLMMMLEEEKPQFTEEHLDSMRETLNQIVGAISTNLKDIENTPVTADVIDAREVTLSEDLFTQPDLISAQYSLTIGTDEPKTLFAVLTAKSVEQVISGAAGAAAVDAGAPTLTPPPGGRRAAAKAAAAAAALAVAALPAEGGPVGGTACKEEACVCAVSFVVRLGPLREKKKAASPISHSPAAAPPSWPSAPPAAGAPAWPCPGRPARRWAWEARQAQAHRRCRPPFGSFSRRGAGRHCRPPRTGASCREEGVGGHPWPLS